MSAPKPSTSVGKLNTGASIPLVGLGTYLSEDETGYKAVLHAIKVGYRHIDCAALYKNEDFVGRAIRDSGVPREELFVTTKVWNTQHREPAKALEESLSRLGLDYVDLFLMHWPQALRTERIIDGNMITVPKREDGKPDVDTEWNYIKTWHLMQDLPASGKTKAVGVSNFSVKQLEKLLADPGSKVVPACNQVEVHPLLPQIPLYDFCKKKNIMLAAYSPLGSQKAPLLDDPVILEITAKHKADPAQIIIGWDVKRGYVALPKSVTPSRIESNLQIVNLTDSELEKINEIHKKGEKRVVDPEWFDFEED